MASHELTWDLFRPKNASPIRSTAHTGLGLQEQPLGRVWVQMFAAQCRPIRLADGHERKQPPERWEEAGQTGRLGQSITADGDVRR
jgi:hypothetical protein